jgi:hypothetical protein
MDLKQIRAQVQNITDYSPEIQSYANQLDELINLAYQKLWTMKRWNFAQKLSFLEAYPDITSERELGDPLAAPILATYTDGQRLVTFNNNVFTMENKKDIYEGNIIQLGSREYTILQILSATQLVTAEPIRIINGVASITDDKAWRIKARFYTLPEDCIEILNLQHRDIPVGSGGQGTILPPYGKTVCMLPRMEEVMGLREDYTQTYAEAYVPVPPTIVPPGEKLDIGFTENEEEAIGGLTSGYHFEICWSLISPDKQTGPLSESKIVVVPTNPQAPQALYSMNLKFLTWDDKDYLSLNTVYNSGPGTSRPLESLRKVIWYNQNFDPATGTRLGLPKWRQVVKGTTTGGLALNFANRDEPILTADTVATATILNLTSFVPGTKQYREYDGQHLRIRPYPRIDAFDFQYGQTTTGPTIPVRLRDFFRRLELRYYYKPQMLSAATDTPELPFEFHQTIVYIVLEDVYNKAGNLQLAQLYARKADLSLKDLLKRYVDHQDTMVVRGQFGAQRYGPIFDQNSLRNKSI